MIKKRRKENGKGVRKHSEERKMIKDDIDKETENRKWAVKRTVQKNMDKKDRETTTHRKG